MKLKEVYKQILSEQKYKVYHGSNHQFTKFDFNKTAQKIAWFSNSVEDIKSGNAGADSAKYIMEFEITLNNPAGWDEYESLGLGQIKDRGFDGVILDDNGATNYIVFDRKNIKFVKNL